MNTNTKYFGEVSYEQTDVLHLPDGLFGFEEEKEFLLIKFDDNNDVLLCLQSLNNDELAFIIASPFTMEPDYNPHISPEDMSALSLTDDSTVTFYVLCVIQDDLASSTVNLKSPLVINSETRVCRQVILDQPNYSFKHPFAPKQQS